MKLWQCIFIMVVLYVSAVGGISIKMKYKGVEGAYILLSFLFPFIILSAIVLRLFDILFEKDRKFKDKVSEIGDTVYVGITSFPMLVGFISARLAKALDEGKKKKHRRKSPKNLIGNVLRSYDIFTNKYTSQMQEKFAH